jgi:hypothetical protein
MRVFTSAIGSLAMAMLSCVAPGHGAGETWKAGFARAKITPAERMWMAGYGSRTHPADGKLHDLWVKAMALEDAGGQRAVVLTSDLLGFPGNMSDTICAEIKTRFGLERAQVMLSASHTHCGPVLRGALYDIYPLDDHQRGLIEAYSARLEKTVVETIGRAISDLRPASLAFGQGTCGFAANRRENKEADVPGLRAAGQPTRGPSDHAVPILSVRDPDGQPVAIVFGYACHNTTLNEYLWCGDYAGFAQIRLEEKHPGAQAMFVAGCGADQNPMPRRTVEFCQNHGNELAEAVERVLGNGTEPVAPRLRTAFEFITLDFERPLGREDLVGAIAKGGYEARWGRRLLAELESGRQLTTSCRYPVQVWRLGEDRLWIALGGEVVVDYALKFKERFGPKCWVSGYANDVMAYIPSRRVREEGRYEAGAFPVYGLPAQRWCADIEERISAAVVRLCR